MMHKRNKGVSMVEILIALAIFMIMMIPLVSSMLSSMKTTTSAKELQYRNEYARNLMENIKEVPVSVLKTESSIKDYLKGLGSTDVNLSSSSGTEGTYKYETYQITGTTYIGTEPTKYYYEIKISNQDYAKMQKSGSYATNPNNLTSTYVESLDQNKVALISAPYANYDTPAFDALLTKKMTEIRKVEEDKGNIFDPVQAASLFANDNGKRNIHITVTGNEASGYDVSCKLIYSDGCLTHALSGNTISQEIGTVEYTPYAKHFKELPNIYLMYNVCIYNGLYSDDYITFDVSGVQNADEIRVFVISTADKATNATANGITLPNVSGDVVLYKKGLNAADRNGTRIGFAGTKTTNLDKLKVYHNFNNGSNSLNVTSTANMNSFFGTSYTNVTPVSYEESQSDRGLYTIEIRMSESADVTSTEPVLQGSRGGDAID